MKNAAQFHNYNTRHSANYCFPIHHRTMTEKKPNYAAAKMWNTLPPNLKMSKKQNIQETVDLINRGQYQLACTKYFEITQGTPPERFINHPNQYFEESQNVKHGKSNTKKEFTGDKPQPALEKRPAVSEEL
ncbi:hypothetical protein J6590_028065 [Homalodisca vitripennis]|nr:hypothetical protein J6590_028065 [Homalodisca vitripennis]